MFRYGRTNRTTYWLSLGVAALIFIVLLLLTSKAPHIVEIVVIAVATPRLHDIGRSGWWVASVIATEVVLAVIVFTTLPLDTASAVMGLFAVILAGLLIWLGAIPGQPHANEYGEAPGKIISLWPRRIPSRGFRYCLLWVDSVEKLIGWDRPNFFKAVGGLVAFERGPPA